MSASPPRWCLALLRRLAPAARANEIEGDLREAHAARLRRRGRRAAVALTILDTFDMARVLLAERLRSRAGRRATTSRACTSRGFAVSILDFKLGARMLVRYPGLTLLGGLAMAFAIFAGAGTYEFLTQVVRPMLPLPDGDRIVGVRLWHAASSSVEEQASFDFARWREGLKRRGGRSGGRRGGRRRAAGDGRRAAGGEPGWLHTRHADTGGLCSLPFRKRKTPHALPRPRLSCAVFRLAAGQRPNPPKRQGRVCSQAGSPDSACRRPSPVARRPSPVARRPS
ncbi:MAG: hypothetical protein WEF86_15075, partial [Gemmatimonadota bacterium]